MTLEFSGKSGLVLLKDREIKEPVKLKDCKDCRIENCSFRYDRTDTTLLSMSDCVSCKIINCKFSDKSTKGLFIKISGSKSKDNEITGCELWNHTFNKENGGEPVRLGNSDVSGCWFNTKVTKCLFHDLRSDVETISIKSCGNVIEDCDFENNASNITLRHGGFNKIVNNRFVGKGGIRVLGTGNEISNNYFKNNQDDKYYPIRIEYGNVERDPNFTSNNMPTGKEGKSHATYAQIRDGTISDNKFENCKETIKTVTRDRKYGPINNKMENNNVVQAGNSIPPDEDDKDDEQEEKPDSATITEIKAMLEELKATFEVLKKNFDELRATIIESEREEPEPPAPSELPTQ